MPRFRALRESLLSNDAPLPIFTAALEASSDACLRAGNFAEFLKSVQQLVLVSYPALAAEDPASLTLHLTHDPLATSVKHIGHTTQGPGTPACVRGTSENF